MQEYAVDTEATGQNEYDKIQATGDKLQTHVEFP